jgi:hypothetical protein
VLLQKVEKDEAYIKAIVNLATVAEQIVKENNAIDIYEEYWEGARSNKFHQLYSLRHAEHPNSLAHACVFFDGDETQGVRSACVLSVASAEGPGGCLIRPEPGPGHRACEREHADAAEGPQPQPARRAIHLLAPRRLLQGAVCLPGPLMLRGLRKAAKSRRRGPVLSAITPQQVVLVWWHALT